MGNDIQIDNEKMGNDIQIDMIRKGRNPFWRINGGRTKIEYSPEPFYEGDSTVALEQRLKKSLEAEKYLMKSTSTIGD